MYELYIKDDFMRREPVYFCVCESEDMYQITETIKKKVLEGTPVDKIKIVKTVDFEFKCGVQIVKETEK